MNGLVDYFFFLQNFSEQMPDFFTESWSLSIEEFSYLLGPLFIFLLLFVGLKNKKMIFLGVSLAVILLGIVNRLYFNQTHEVLNYLDWSHNLRKVVIFRIDSIYYGFIGAYASRCFQEIWQNNKVLLSVCGLALFLAIHVSIAYFNLQPNTSPSFYNNLYLPLLLTSLVLLFPLFSNWKKDTYAWGGAVRYLSLTSYAIYLVNYSLILLTIQFFTRIEGSNIWGKLGLLVFYWVSILLAAHMLYHYFEKPIMKLRDRPIFKAQLWN